MIADKRNKPRQRLEGNGMLQHFYFHAPPCIHVQMGFPFIEVIYIAYHDFVIES